MPLHYLPPIADVWELEPTASEQAGTDTTIGAGAPAILDEPGDVLSLQLAATSAALHAALTRLEQIETALTAPDTVMSRARIVCAARAGVAIRRAWRRRDAELAAAEARRVRVSTSAAIARTRALLARSA